MACVRKRRGKWIIDFYDQFGKRRWETVGPNKKKAEEKLAKRLLEVGKGTYKPESQAERFTEVAEEWYKTQVLPNKRHKTAYYYRNHLDNHLMPYFGRLKILRVADVGVIEKYIAKKLLEGMSKATINKTITTLGTVMRYAVRRGFVDTNPVSYVQKLKRGPEELIEDKRYLTPEEIRIFLSKAEEKHYPLLLTAILTGMREGELLGLMWTDIDWNAKQICVRRTLQAGRFYEPKTRTSKRRIDMAPELVSVLKKWKLKCPNGEHDLVFPAINGKPMDAVNMLRVYFYPTLRKSGLPKIRFHDLRHTYASLLIMQGEHPKYIQSQMGHSSINVTMDCYGHLMKATNQDSAKKLGATVLGKKLKRTGSKMVAGGSIGRVTGELSG